MGTILQLHLVFSGVSFLYLILIMFSIIKKLQNENYKVIKKSNNLELFKGIIKQLIICFFPIINIFVFLYILFQEDEMYEHLKKYLVEKKTIRKGE